MSTKEQREKVKEKMHAAAQAIGELYQVTTETHEDDQKYSAVVIDVSAQDVQERYRANASTLRSMIKTLRESGLPEEFKTPTGPVVDRRGRDLREVSEAEAKARDSSNVEGIVKELETQAKALEWMADRVPAGAVFRLGEGEARRLWDSPTTLAETLGKLLRPYLM